MAETAITAVLSKLGELAVSEAKILLQVGDDIILLRDRLEWLQAFVRDADRKRRAGTDGLTRVWVRQTRDVAFDDEDALDDFFHEEVVGIKALGCRRRWKTFQKYFTGFFTKIVVRHGLSDQMKIISNRLEHISEHQKEYQIVYTPSVVLSSSTTAIAAWRDDLENAKGFNYDAGLILDLLSPERIDRPIFISIVGESGAGKSTLARVIRRMNPRSSEVKVVWYNMEPGCTPDKFLTEVHRLAKLELTVTAHEQVYANSDEIGRKLYHVLNGQNFLLILGGISSKTILNSMRASLPDSGCQVMLLLDSENEDIAWHAGTMNSTDAYYAIHLLTRLSEKRTRKLFFWKVLRKQPEESDDDEDVEDIEQVDKEQDEKRSYGKRVHEITGGYPMAIVLLAGLLRFKEKPLEWDAVLQHLMSAGNNGTHRVQLGGSENNGTQDGSEGLPDTQISNLSGGTRRAMEMVFWASFEDLHNDLRSCYLYFASFPTNSSQPADQLVRMWIGEGFIKPRRGKTMEEVGHDYLKELVLRCLVEVEEMKANGGIQLVRVHKSLMGFLESEAREAGFMEIHDIHDVIVPPSVRRLSVQSDNGRRYNITLASKKFPKLRSFICRIIIMTKHQHDLEFLLSSRFLRIISVEGLNLSELPEKIGDMIQLRYLRIDCRSLESLPLSIARLLNLQTLDISNTGVQKIESDFWKIRTLRHVLASNLTLPTKMPVVDETDDESGLQTLHGVKPVPYDKWIKGNCPLDKMTNLLSLEMHGFQYAEHGGEAFEAALANMHRLGHLKLQGDEIPLCVFTNPSLRSLETMELHGQVQWVDILGSKSENIAVVGEIVPENTVVGDIIRKDHINVPAEAGDTVREDNISMAGDVVIDAVISHILELRPSLVQLRVNDINPVSPSMEDQLWEIIVGQKRATGGGGAEAGGEVGGQRPEEGGVEEEARRGIEGGGEVGGQRREGEEAAGEVGEGKGEQEEAIRGGAEEGGEGREKQVAGGGLGEGEEAKRRGAQELGRGKEKEEEERGGRGGEGEATRAGGSQGVAENQAVTKRGKLPIRRRNPMPVHKKKPRLYR